MAHPALAFPVRFLREDARSWWPYLARVSLLGVGMFFMVTTVDSYSYSRSVAPGRDLFWGFTLIGLGLAHIFGISFFSSVVTEEREDQTLGLLVMTGIPPWAILAAKAGTRLLGILIVGLVSLPLTLLCFALGGVRPGQVLEVYLVVGVILLFLCALGTLCSTLVSSSRRAAAWTVALLGGFHLMLPVLKALEFLGREWGWWPSGGALAWLAGAAEELFEGLNPYFLLARGLASSPQGMVRFADLTGPAVFIVVLFALAGWRFRVLCRDLGRGGAEGAAKRTAPVAAGAATGRRARNRVPVIHPVAWKERRYLFRRPWMLVGYPILLTVAFSGIAAWITAISRGSFGRILPEVMGPLLIGSGLFLAVLRVLSLFCETFSREIQQQTFAALCTTPIGLAGVVRQKLVTAFRGIWFEGLCVAIGSLITPRLWPQLLVEFVENPFSVLIIFVYCVSLAGVLWVNGLYLGLRLKRSAQAVAMAVTFFGGIIFNAMLMSGARGADGMKAMLAVATVLHVLYIGAVWVTFYRRLEEAVAED